MARAASPVQVRLAPSLFDFAEDQAEALDPVFEEPDLRAKKVDCYDVLGVAGFNLEVPVDRVELTPGAGTLALVVELGTVQGSDMLVYGLDEDYLDTCAEFDAELKYVTLSGARLEATVAVDTAADGGLALSWAAAPVLTGDLDMDIDWFPDDLVLYFVEDAIFEAVSDTLAEAVLPEVEAFAAQPLLDGDYADYAVLMALEGASAATAGLDLDIGAEVAFMGTPACETGTAATQGDAPALDLSDGGEAHVVLGLTEAFVDALMVESWRSGAYCEEPEAFAELVEDLQVFLDSGAVAGDARASLDAPPRLSLDGGAARLRLEGLRIQVDGTLDGASATLVDAVMDVEGDAVLGLSPSGSLLGLSLAEVEVDFGTLDLQGVQGGLEAWVEELVEGEAARMIEAELGQVPLFDAAYAGYGLVVRIEEAAAVDGGLRVALRLYDEDDPEVDRVAPDTAVELVGVSGDDVEIAWSGTDDQSTALAFAAQVDGQGWSDWTEDPGVELYDLLEGEHTIEVKARDAWLNEDPSPATLVVEVGPPLSGAEQLAEACGCGGGAPAGLLGLPPLVAVALRRRRRGRAGV